MENDFYDLYYNDVEIIHKILKNISKIIIFRYINNYAYKENINDYDFILQLLKKKYDKNFFQSSITLSNEIFNYYSSNEQMFVNKNILIKIFLSNNQYAKLNSNVIEQSVKSYKDTHHIFISLGNNQDKIIKMLHNKYNNFEVFSEIELITNYWKIDFMPKFSVYKNDSDIKKIKECNEIDNLPKNLKDMSIKLAEGKTGNVIKYDLFNDSTIQNFNYRQILNINIVDENENNDDDMNDDS